MANLQIVTQITDWEIGDILVGTSAGRSSRLPAPIDTKLRVLAQKGTGKTGSIPYWAELSGAIPGLAAIATSGSASDLLAGTIPAATLPTFTGDITNLVDSLALTIASGAVDNGKLAKMPPMTIKGNNSILVGSPKDLTVADVIAMGLGGSSGGPPGSGTVTSVGLSVPVGLVVSGTPITTTGTLAVTWATQAANLAFLGPASGAAATPGFRSLVIADIPDLSSVYQSLNAKLTSFGALGNALGFLHNDGSGVLAWSAAGGGTGTVTSIGLTVPSILSVAGSPVTTSGTLALSLATQGANLVWAGPSSGAAATPTFRALIGADIPDLSSVYQPLSAILSNLTGLANAVGALTNDGSGVLSWTPGSGGGTPAGLNTQIQYNNSGAFGASADLTWDSVGKVLTSAGNFIANKSGAGTFFSIEVDNRTSLAPTIGVFQNQGGPRTWGNYFYSEAGTSDFLFTSRTSGTDNIALRIENATRNASFSSNVSIGSNINSGTTFVIQASDTPILRFKTGTSNRFIGGVAGGPGEFIAGSVANDFCLSNQASGGFVFSTDNGAGVAMRLSAGAGGAVQFPQLVLTTGLTIAVATKTFPLTVNGTVVNVLCA
jgi:hypothetical protein